MKNIVYVAACALLVCTSCVTKKKYMIAENGRLEAVGRGGALKEELVNCKDEADRQTARIADLLRDTTELGRTVRNYQTMLNTNLSEQEKLNSLLQQKMNILIFLLKKEVIMEFLPIILL